MNIKQAIILLFVLQTFFCFSQEESTKNLEVVYEFTKSADTLKIFDTNSFFILKANKKESIYEKIDEKLAFLKDEDIKVKNKGSFTLRDIDDNHKRLSLNKQFVYKNIQEDTLLFNSPVFNKEYFIGEKLDKMKWTLIDRDTIISDLKCKIAKTSFRGRDYEVCYSTEILLNDGPWKFYGLPGLVISAKSTDNIFVFKALKIKLSDETIINKPKIEKKIITWNEYKLVNYKVMKAIIKRLKAQSEDGDEVSIKVSNQLEDIRINEFKK